MERTTHTPLLRPDSPRYWQRDLEPLRSPELGKDAHGSGSLDQTRRKTLRGIGRSSERELIQKMREI